MLSSLSVLSLLAVGILASPAPQAHPTGSAEAYLSSGSDYQNAVLFHHNFHRQNHNAASLVWNATSAQNAMIAAQKCQWAHYVPPGVSEGQNIYANSFAGQNVTAGITETWYKKEFPTMNSFWGKEVPDANFSSVGHLTQMVWKSTTAVGCVSVDCGNKMVINGQVYPHFTVCNYYPPGNWKGQFAAMVGSPISRTNLGSWSM